MSQGEKIADRPHWITIVLGAFSPTLTILALWMSYKSFSIAQNSLQTSRESVQTSQQSMKIGQRAYLSIQQGFLDTPKVLVGGPPNAAYVLSRFTIHNLGNTPGTIISIKAGRLIPQDWKAVGPQTSFVPFPIGQKDSVPREEAQEYFLEPEALKLFDEQREHIARFRQQFSFNKPNSGNLVTVRVPVVIAFALTFVDVFNEAHSLSWCYEENYLSKDHFPNSCREGERAIVRQHLGL